MKLPATGHQSGGRAEGEVPQRHGPADRVHWRGVRSARGRPFDLLEESAGSARPTGRSRGPDPRGHQRAL